ncbi:MAG: adenine deaminase, partial [Clostridia bacterium]|nr:adenine deaminase [Clostridia bacterium]
GILNSDTETHNIVGETLKADKVVTGHYSMPETGKGLNAYIAMGSRNCHESTRAIDALEKMRRGETAFFREGSAWHDLKEVSKAIVGKTLDTRYASLCSDDTHPNTLVGKGHLDHIIRRAVEEGIDILTAIQMVTINTATSFRMDNELGSIAPSKCADIVFIDDLKSLNVTKVMIDGKLVAENGKLTFDIANYQYPDWATNSMKIRDTISADSFRLASPDNKQQHTVRVIEVIPARVGTVAAKAVLTAKHGLLSSDTQQDILKAVVFERHNRTGTKGFGFVKGFGIKNGAMASTVAHDAHNLMVIGTCDEDMALAANTLIASGGGLVTVRDGKVLAHVPLPIAGLMNDKTAVEMSVLVQKLESSWIEIGCAMPSPFMTMALIPLACLPELRLTNRGLVDSNAFVFVDLLLD